MVNLKIHLIQGLVHMLDMHAGHLHQILAVSHQRSDLTNGPALDETMPSANPQSVGIAAIGNPTRRIFDREHGVHVGH